MKQTKNKSILFAMIIAGAMVAQNAQAQTYGQGNLATGAGCTAAGTAGDCSDTYVGNLTGANVTANSLRNTFLGAEAGNGNTATRDNTAVGFRALFTQSYNSNVNTYNVAVGDSALYNNQPAAIPNNSGRSNVAVGSNSANKNTTGQGLVCMGFNAGYNNTTADYLTAIGFQAGHRNTTGSNNTLVGLDAGFYNATGGNNTSVGWEAGFGVAGNDNSSNCFFGYRAGFGITTGIGNVCVGREAGAAMTTSGTAGNPPNVIVGYLAGNVMTTAVGNVVVGQSAGQGITTSRENVVIGSGAGATITTNSNNTCVGTGANIGANTYSNATALGNGSTVNASNNMMFGNTSVVGWGFGATPNAATQALIVGTGVTNGNGANLTLGGAWTNGSSRTFKDNITELDGKDILNKIGKLEVARWRYKGTEEYHIGPFAEEFYELFHTGVDNRYISTIDPAGIALAAIKELIKKDQVQQNQIEEQKAELTNAKTIQAESAQMKSELAAVKDQIAQLEKALAQCCTNYQQGSVLGNEGKVSSTDMPALEQNTPNPFKENTMIKYYIPQVSKNAQVIIYSSAGEQVMNLNVSKTGYGQTSITGNSLSAGIYSYCLMIDGKVVDVKQMILTK